MFRKLAFLFYVLGLFLFAQETQVRIEIDRHTMSLQQETQLKFIIENGQAGSHNFTPPADFYIKAGPFKSSSTSMSWVNGVSQNSQNVSITYLVSPKKKGAIEIPVYTYQDKNGIEYRTEPLTILVIDDTATSNNSSLEPDYEATLKQNQGKDIFSAIETNKKKAFVGEPILLTYQIYAAIDLSGILSDAKPSIKNVWSEEIKLGDKGYEVKQVSLNGRAYYCYTLKKEVIYPQKAGKIDVGIWKISVNTGDGFFSPKRSYDLQSKAFDLNIDALPQPKPKNFSGLVGTFTLTSSINKKTLATNEAINLNFKIQGKGNINLFNKLPIEFHTDFEIFDPKISEALTSTTEGTQGSKSFDYVVIPRFSGQYTLPQLDISYFDLKEKKYQTLSSEKFTIEVLKGNTQKLSVSQGNLPAEDLPTSLSNSTKQTIKNDQVLRYLQVDGGKMMIKSELFSFSDLLTRYIYFLSSVFLFLLVHILLREQKKRHTSGKKRISSKATKMLKKAKDHLKEADQKVFVRFVHDLLLDYLSEKLKIQKFALNTANIEDGLAFKKVPDSLIASLLSLLENLESSRYSPVMGDNSAVYHQVEQILLSLDKKLK